MTYNITTNVDASYISDPVNTNYLKPNSFRFIFNRLPNVQYFCQSINLPKITLGSAMQQSPLVKVPHAGDQLEYDPLNIVFMVDENMTNYIELYSWMMGLGFPKSRDQYASLLADPSSRFTAADKMLETNAYSDASLFILNSSNNPIVEVKYQNVFPISIEGMDFDLRIPTVDYFTGIASFRYTFYEILPINNVYSSTV